MDSEGGRERGRRIDREHQGRSNGRTDREHQGRGNGRMDREHQGRANGPMDCEHVRRRMVALFDGEVVSAPGEECMEGAEIVHADAASESGEVGEPAGPTGAADVVGAEEAAQIRRHLADCADCTAEWSALAKLRALTREHLQMTAPEGLKASILAAAEASDAADAAADARVTTGAEGAVQTHVDARAITGAGAGTGSILARLMRGLRVPRAALAGAAVVAAVVLIVMGLRMTREEAAAPIESGTGLASSGRSASVPAAVVVLRYGETKGATARPAMGGLDLKGRL